MSHSKRVTLVLGCGHLIGAAGRIDDTRHVLHSLTTCPQCHRLQEVVEVLRHSHAVPAREPAQP